MGFKPALPFFFSPMAFSRTAVVSSPACKLINLQTSVPPCWTVGPVLQHPLGTAGLSALASEAAPHMNECLDMCWLRQASSLSRGRSPRFPEQAVRSSASWHLQKPPNFPEAFFFGPNARSNDASSSQARKVGPGVLIPIPSHAVAIRYVDPPDVLNSHTPETVLSI